MWPLYILAWVIAGWVIAGPRVTALISIDHARQPRCHQKNSHQYEYRSSFDCDQVCEEGCWRPGVPRIEPGDVVYGAFISGLIWPLLFVGILIWKRADRQLSKHPKVLKARIAELESEIRG